jgi:hypothetical protein
VNIIINEELRSFIDPLTASEYAALERSLLSEGCRDALVLWGEVLIDGHNRYHLCRKHGIEFKTVQNTRFGSIEDVMLWMIDNHLARRSVSDYQRGVLALRKKDIVTARAAERAGQPEPQAPEEASPAVPPAPPVATRADLGKLARVSSNTIGQIERIQKAATPELVEAVRAGTISINAAATVASLPEAEQIAAVAGGRKQLQQAARMVREQQAAVRPPKSPAADESPAPEGAADEAAQLRVEVALLKAKVAQLTAQNTALEQALAQAQAA